MATLVTHHGTLYPGRVHYVVLNLSARLQLGIIDVYGFSKTGPRAMLWNHLANTPLPEATWILAGDFNNIESVNDKQGGSANTSINIKELEVWSRLVICLGVKDAFHARSFHRKNDKAFTWTDAHRDETMIQTRIDRIYIDYKLEDTSGHTEILPTIPDLSNHAGVILHTRNTVKKKARPPFFNKGILYNPATKALLLETWKTVMNSNLESWNQKLVAAHQAIREKSEELTKAQKQKWKETYLSQFDDINAAEEELQRNWGSREARHRLSDAQAILHEVRQ